MSRRLIFGLITFLIFVLCSSPAYSQIVRAENDSAAKVDTSLWVAPAAKELKTMTPTEPIFKPDPKKAVLYSLLFPGLGQIYNKKYWKLPIVYGGFIGLTYAISWNGKYYNDYSRAYKDIMSDDPYKNNSWFDFVKFNYNSIEDVSSSDLTWLQSQFQRKKNYYRRYRDLSIIGMVGLYAVAAIDAYVDAQLFDFDISDNLSMRLEPALIPTQSTHVLDSALGVNCNIRF